MKASVVITPQKRNNFSRNNHVAETLLLPPYVG